MDERDFWLADAPVDLVLLRRRVEHERAGAFASFEGWVRNHNEGRPVLGLRYESYVALAEAEGAKVVAEARERFALCAAVCVHRIGDLAIGDMAVWVGVSAPHRGAAFDACRYIIDEIKDRVPIWKHERYADGDAGWLHPEPVRGDRA
ncbi:molybdenum cofactor biosynthesis protein MoaE [Luteimonas sp. 100069]|uniref:molybdenum cofactor biosynthesis protein MoaE n=1 Tax=Luteimonas sp. 100069 TaxID=2006109 RepID=UPI000F50DB1F|nr:molybdenum cofactor biosynthesis protein MoaE [Luteimonas sp. 100069]RPD85789.1 molybdenum cofactor biosynthesis protein MoaE [Luteimonas sp. 100069]